jgi:mRNA interferase MazF
LIQRGDIFYANLNPVQGSEQGGQRPVLIIQNDVGNMYSPTTIIAAITSRIKRAKLPTHVELSAARFQMEKDSVILLEQMRTIDKQRLMEKITKLDVETMLQVDRAIEISLGLKEIN